MNHKGRSPGRLFKLAGSTLALDVSPAAAPGVDAARMCVHAVISTPTQDRENDVVLPEGMDLSQHARNPAVLLDHGLAGYTLPVAKALDPAGNYAVALDGGLLKAAAYFTARDRMSEQVFALYAEGLMRAFSVGFIPTALKRLPPAEGNPYARPGFLIERSLLTEFSCCAVGCNHEALTVAVQKGRLAGGPLHPVLVKSLTPYTLPRKPLVRGVTMTEPDAKTQTKDEHEETPVDGGLDEIPELEPEAPDDRPPGSAFLSGLFGQLCAALADAQAATQEGPARQEKQEILDDLPTWADGLATLAAELAELHNRTYPDQPKLEAPAASDSAPQEGGDEPADGPPADKRQRPARTKAMTKAATNVIRGAVETLCDVKDNVAMSRVYKNAMEREIDNLGGLVAEPAAEEAEEETVPKSRYEQLLKNFGTLEKNHQNLVSRVTRLLRQ